MAISDAIKKLTGYKEVSCEINNLEYTGGDESYTLIIGEDMKFNLKINASPTGETLPT